MRRLLTVVVILCWAGLAWYYRDSIRAVWDRVVAAEPARVPSAELAEAAQAKLAGLSTGRETRRVTLTQAEVQSLVSYRLQSLLPSYIVAPSVELKDGRIHLRAQVPTERFPRVEELGEIMGFLPDTTEIHAAGQLFPLDGGRTGFAVDEVSAAKVPVPRGLIPTLLRRMGRRDEPGLPPDALALPLPDGAAAAYVRGDSLVLVPASETR